MIRTQPPRGRAVSFALLAAVVMTLMLAVPASAAAEPDVAVASQVTGRDALRITPDGLPAPVPLVVEITDAAGTVATWRYPATLVANGTPLSVDLSQPHAGTPPRNGGADVTVSTAAGVVGTAATTIDRTPPTPSLHSVVRGHRVGLTWSAVPAPDQVTYKLERIATGGSWIVVEESTAADGFTDRELAPGRYRYRLTAGVPGADGGTNWSVPSAIQLRIAAPTPTPTPTPTQAKPAPQPTTSKPAAATPPAKPQRRRQQPPRSVAATGTVRAPLPVEDRAQQQQQQQLQGDPTPLISTADEPAVDGSAPPIHADVPAVQTPQVAAPATAAPATAAPPQVAPPALEPFPVTVPPAGSLAVSAATQTPPDPVTLLSGLVFLLLAAGVVAGIRKRSGLPIIPPWVARR